MPHCAGAKEGTSNRGSVTWSGIGPHVSLGQV